MLAAGKDNIEGEKCTSHDSYDTFSDAGMAMLRDLKEYAKGNRSLGHPSAIDLVKGMD